MKFLSLLIFTVAIGSCNNSSNPATEKTTENEPPAAPGLVFDKIVGLWQSDDGKSFERWTRDKDQYLTAGFSINGADTSWNEQGKVFQENGKWIFENMVNGQNDGKVVRFTSSSLSETSVQFSNPEHDFPTDINYSITDASVLEAFIVGPNRQGGKDTISFGFKRVK